MTYQFTDLEVLDGVKHAEADVIECFITWRLIKLFRAQNGFDLKVKLSPAIDELEIDFCCKGHMSVQNAFVEVLSDIILGSRTVLGVSPTRAASARSAIYGTKTIGDYIKEALDELPEEAHEEFISSVQAIEVPECSNKVSKPKPILKAKVSTLDKMKERANEDLAFVNHIEEQQLVNDLQARLDILKGLGVEFDS